MLPRTSVETCPEGFVASQVRSHERFVASAASRSRVSRSRRGRMVTRPWDRVGIVVIAGFLRGPAAVRDGVSRPGP